MYVCTDTEPTKFGQMSLSTNSGSSTIGLQALKVNLIPSIRSNGSQF